MQDCLGLRWVDGWLVLLLPYLTAFGLRVTHRTHSLRSATLAFCAAPKHLAALAVGVVQPCKYATSTVASRHNHHLVPIYNSDITMIDALYRTPKDF